MPQGTPALPYSRSNLVKLAFCCVVPPDYTQVERPWPRWAAVTESLTARGQMRERCLTERVSTLEWKALLKKEAFCNAEDRNVIQIKPKTFRKLIPWLSCDYILYVVLN